MEEKTVASEPQVKGIDSDVSIDRELVDDKALEKRVTRKVDIRLVPMLCMLYMTAYLDRTNIGRFTGRLLRLRSHSANAGVLNRQR
jgi:hypothetical protein